MDLEGPTAHFHLLIGHIIIRPCFCDGFINPQLQKSLRKEVHFIPILVSLRRSIELAHVATGHKLPCQGKALVGKAFEPFSAPSRRLNEICSVISSWLQRLLKEREVNGPFFAHVAFVLTR